nr:LysR substrate-binding domain-containing protein [Peteryoungia ipomoeae]
MRLLVEIERRGSLSAAAIALRLSQPAVSYQVRNLEQRFGVALLQRLHRGVRFTEEGRRLLQIAIRAVEDIDALERSLAAARRRPTVRLTTDYAFSGLWLLPRMQAFRADNPTLDLQIVASQRLGPHWRDSADVAVAFGARPDFDGDAILLMSERVVPVCSPAFAERLGTRESALSGLATRIHLDAEATSPWLDWQSYLRECGVTLPNEHGPGDLRFNTYSMVIQAALGGAGLALGWRGIVDQLLDAGLLTAAGPEVEIADRGYWLVTGHKSEPALHLASWLESQVKDRAG